ncbi:hypothetical protein Vafri_13634 [Volvox africanus]|uniref:Uncharacterized protein n=1 Tax=Volvox africanus TaxID=51714 RepID=A0A8J4BH20_9CHLO|nr:hypothetical protein Vafri_13634 [Volvox africanus]
MMKPTVDPLREEYEKAAEEEDVEDLSTEDGDWLSRPREDCEELDENGIPIMKLSRASSSFILDGPGDVKVDNFTPEGDVQGELEGRGDNRAPLSSPAPLPDASADISAGAVYIPSAFARVHRESGTEAIPAPTAAAAPAQVLTLEDEIRAMRAAARAASGGITEDYSQPNSQCPPQQSGPSPQQQEGEADATGRSLIAGSDDEDEAPEVVPEPQRALLPLAGGGVGAYGRSSGGPQPLGLRIPAPPGTVLSGGVSLDMTGEGGVGRAAASGADDEATCLLPGTCLDTQHEDSLWAALQGVDGRALLEHLGLAGSSPQPSVAPDQETGGDVGQIHHQEQGQPGGSSAGDGGNLVPLLRAGAAPAVTGLHAREGVASGLANGHHHEVEGGRPSNGDVGTSDVCSSGSGAANWATGAAADSATSASAAAVPMPDVGNGLDEGAGQEAPDSASPGGAIAGRPLQPPGDGPIFEEVQAFRLDPDFDYDNVQLTVRDFPYSLLSVRDFR